MRTNVRYLLSLLLLSLQACASDMNDEIYWPKTKSYSEHVAKLKLSEVEAHDLLMKVPRTRPGSKYFDYSPILLVGEWYFFSVPEKIESNLTGYYVNGNSGEVQLRVSDQKITKSSRAISTDGFSSVERLLPNK